MAELEAEDYEKVEEGMFISGFWNVILKRGDERVELSCSAAEQEEVDNGTIAPENAEWWVQLVVVWELFGISWIC